MKLPDDVIAALLDRWPVARLATVNPSGQPHSVPIVFARVGEEIWTPVDGKPKRAHELARVENARANPRVSLLLDHYDSDWKRLWWLRVDATARIVRPPGGEADPGVGSAVAALRGKYPQYEDVPVLREPPTLLVLTPQRVRSWGASPEAVQELPRR